MPLRGPFAASRIAALTVCSVAGFSSSAVRSTSETLGVGTRTGMPSSLPLSAGMTRPIARAATVAVGEGSAALGHEPDAERLPGELGGVALGKDADRAPFDDEAVLLGADLLAKGPVHGIVLQQVRERLRVRDVVDRHELERLVAQAGAQNVPADASETVDPDADLRHEPP